MTTPLSEPFIGSVSSESTEARMANRGLAAFLAAMLGIMVVFVAGFASGEVVHNAAHDSRHSFSFPCH